MADMRLIDANSVVTIQVFDEMTEEYYMQTMTVAEMVDRWTDEGCPPTIDAVPVVHGRWIDRGDYVTTAYGSLDIKVCSCCENEITIDDFDSYCPDCGARMDGQDTNAPTNSDRGCSTCANDGMDMPQCRECTEHPGYPWYKRRDGGANV